MLLIPLAHHHREFHIQRHCKNFPGRSAVPLFLEPVYCTAKRG